MAHRAPEGMSLPRWGRHLNIISRPGRGAVARSARGIFTRAAIEFILKNIFGARGFGGRHAPMMSPRQLKEVIQVAHTNVGSVASLGALVGGEVHR